MSVLKFPDKPPAIEVHFGGDWGSDRGVKPSPMSQRFPPTGVIFRKILKKRRSE
ncbi:hypothetical protein [Lyngbya sp. CCY1209]|uniref:hypothetical protein n=1 Tax=Lyngbya sp. CCY1209 TaxID=2886103 RepID=UPI002D200881|nr:hypothetical protein [Lyngbya sp. CCY1209]MEB3882066.1 hypothetical protein [Lyngbya sp. CCY1209]